MLYEPKKKSLKKHKVPDWFHDAKLGIFVHWSLFSVPAFATNVGTSIKDVVKNDGFEAQFKNSPYAEWYMNAIRIEGSPAQKYHKEKFGEDFTHDDFVPLFNEAIKNWDPNIMADLFKKAGAKYVVLVTKHHDGFLLWPSKFPNFKKEKYMASRNIVGELTEAVRKKGLKMGLYYSGTYDWSFQPNPITDVASNAKNGVMDPEYVEYANNHWYELIDDYKPIILWNDIGYPPKTNINEIFAYYYNKVPEGLINDRWWQIPKWQRFLVGLYVPRKIVSWIVKRKFLKGNATMPAFYHHDYKTPEYGVFAKISKKKWEQTRGIGNSFGYNQFEKEEDHLSKEELIHEFVDLVSKNGNLLLNVGPMADGTIPEIQKQRLLELGEWLKVNGEAIYGTRPWIKAESITDDDIEVRFTSTNDSLYVILLGKPTSETIIISNLKINEDSSIVLVSNDRGLKWQQKNENLVVSIPSTLKESPAYSLKITPIPKI
jgi:alpha-L-fucosidase